jgi:glycerophosphoryl diester phosphodiesterase
MRRKNILRALAVLLILLVLVYAVLALLSSPIEDHPFFDFEGVMVIAHRGGRGLWPENTLYAFEQAAELGADVLEMDIHSTSDGVLVTMHDDTVDRTTDGSGAIHDFSLTELKELDAGYNWTDDEGLTYPFRDQDITVSTLEEIFVSFPDQRLNIEIKQVEPSIVAPFCQMIRDYDRQETVLVGSFDPETVEIFREECPEVATSTTEPEVRNFFILSTLFLGAVYQAPAEAFQVPEYGSGLHIVTDRFVSGAQNGHNMDVHVWTVNEEDDMQRMLDLGVNGLITDYPDRLLKLLGRPTSETEAMKIPDASLVLENGINYPEG